MNLEKINLLQLLKSFDMGGIERSTINYSEYFGNNLKKVIITGARGFYFQKNLESKKDLFRTTPFPFTYNIFYFFINSIFLLKIIRSEQINLIIYHYRIFIPFIFFVKIFFPGMRIVYAAHSVFDDWINHIIIADKITAVSNSVKKDLEKYDKQKITVINHGEIVREKNQRVHSNRSIGYAGRLSEIKGLQTLLKAFSLLVKEEPRYNLIFRGCGKYEQEIKNYVEKYNLENFVKIESPLYEAQNIYSGIDILVLPSSKLEGFGLVLIEAMSMGIPVVGSAIGGIKEIIKDGHNGFLFEADNYYELKEKIKMVLDDKNLYQKLSNNCTKIIDAEYNISQTIEKYLDLFAGL